MGIGICQLELSNYNEAIQIFEQLIQDEDPLYLNHARWYTALAQLKLNQVDLCKAQLEILIASSQSAYKQQAQKLLAELK